MKEKTLNEQTVFPLPAIQFSEDRKLISCSPYPISWAQLVEKFATSATRQRLANQFEHWLAACREIVIIGEVWIGGSFCNDAQEPKDIDVVLFYRYRSLMPQASARDAFLREHAHVLSNEGAREKYGVDCATISLGLEPLRIVRLAAKWTMILSNGPDNQKRAFYTLVL
jgi:hypothetical protein